MPVTYVKHAVHVPLWVSGFVTITSTAPEACAGVVAEMLVAFTTVTELAAAPPKLTVAGATKPVPVIVTAVPPAVEPLFGFTLVTVGAELTKVKQPEHVPVWVSAFVTTTSTAPAACAGVVALICVALTTVTPLAEDPPNVTVAGPTKPVPVIVTDVPPAVEPLVGATAAAEGAAPNVTLAMRVPHWSLTVQPAHGGAVFTLAYSPASQMSVGSFGSTAPAKKSPQRFWLQKLQL